MGVFLLAICKFCVAADLDITGIDSDEGRKIGSGRKVG